MAINFPNSPTNGQTWTDPSNGCAYVYNSAKDYWRIAGIAGGGGTVNYVDGVGENGIVVTDGPIVNVGVLTISLDIDSLDPLP